MANPNGYIQGKDGKPLELVDATARRQLAGKLDAPGNVKAGDYLRVKSVGEDGTVVVEGTEGSEPDSGQNLTLDTTLTQSGKAADAKATGDEIKRVVGLIPSIEGLAKTEDIPKVPSWAMQASKPGYTASEVGADPQGAAASAVNAHNANTDAHTDLRLEIRAIREQLAAFLDVDEETLNELSELIAAIAANQTSITQLTTGKVSVSDIIDNLTTNVANKPLSAAQGVAIKALIDGLSTGKLDASKLQEAINTALAQAKASGEFDGAKGDPGRGIKSIIRTSGNGAAGTTDTYTITYTDDTTSTFTVRNGSNGAAGKAATFEIAGVTALAYGAAPTVTEASGSTAQTRKYVVGIPAGKPGSDGTTPHIGPNGNWYIGDTDTGQPSLVLADGKYQYVQKSNLTDGYFWYDDSASELPYKYKYANYTVLEPLALRAGTYYLSALMNVYSWVVGSDGVPVRMDAFEPDSAVTTGGFVLTLNEDSTVYLGYHTPAQITASTPYVLDGDKPLDGGYFEGEYKFSLENLLNYGIFVESYIKNGELVANALGVSGDTQGHYTGVKMGANIAEIRCKACFVTGASVALVTTDLGSSMVSDVTFGSVHLVFSLDGCSVGVFDTKDKLRSITHYSYTITEGAEVAFGFAVDEATNTLTVHLPDGATKTVTDDTIGALNGKYAIWEHFCNTASHDFVCCRMTRLYCKDASGEVLDDNLRRLDGAIGVAPTGQVYRQFTTHNLNNRDFV